MEVFECCALLIVGGFGRSYHGITAQEALAACELLAVPAADRAELVSDVQFMGVRVSAAYNERIAAETR